MLSKEIFAEQIMIMGEVYDKKFSEPLLNIYYDILKELTNEQFVQAVNQILRTNKFASMPKPAEFLEFAIGKNSDEPMKAWAITLDAIRRVGGYRTPNFKDTAITDTITHLGGWIKLCDSTTDELVWIAKDFEKFYPMFKQNPTNSKIIGIVNQHNNNENLPTEPIIEIDEKNKRKKLNADGTNSKEIV
jgi:hypothetical protein